MDTDGEQTALSYGQENAPHTTAHAVFHRNGDRLLEGSGPPLHAAPDPTSTPIQAVILAAGRGSRLADAIGNDPKCLAEIGGHPLLEHQLRLLKSRGIERIAIVTGYRADDVRQVAGQRAEYIHNDRWSESNSLYSLWLCHDWVNAALLVLNCDVLPHPMALQRLLASSGNVFAYDASSGADDEHTKVELAPDRTLNVMSKTVSAHRAHGENVGLLYFDQRATRLLFREAETLLRQGWTNMWVTAAVQEVANYVNLRAIDISDLPWIEIDFPDDLERARAVIWPKIHGFYRSPENGARRPSAKAKGVRAMACERRSQTIIGVSPSPPRACGQQRGNTYRPQVNHSPGAQGTAIGRSLPVVRLIERADGIAADRYSGGDLNPSAERNPGAPSEILQVVPGAADPSPLAPVLPIAPQVKAGRARSQRLSVVRGLSSHAWRHWRWLLLGTLAALVVVATRLALPWPFRIITNYWAASGGSAATSGLAWHPPTWDPVLAMGIVFLGLIGLLGLSDFLERLWFSRLASAMVCDLRAATLALTVGEERATDSQPDVGDLVARLVGDAARIKGGMQAFLVHVATNGLVFLGVTLILFSMNVKLGLVFAAAGLATTMVTGWAAGHIFRSALAHRQKEGEFANEIQTALTAGPGHDTLKMLAAAGASGESKQAQYQGLATCATHGIFGVAVLIVLWFGSQAVQAGQLQAGDMVVFMMYALMMRGPIVRLARQGAKTANILAASHRLMQLPPTTGKT